MHLNVDLVLKESNMHSNYFWNIRKEVWEGCSLLEQLIGLRLSENASPSCSYFYGYCIMHLSF